MLTLASSDIEFRHFDNSRAIANIFETAEDMEKYARNKMCAKNTATWWLFLFLHICFCSRVMSDQSMKLFWIQVTETVEIWWQILVILTIIHGSWTALCICYTHKMAAMVSILYCYYFQSLKNFCWSSFLWENSNSISLRSIFKGIEAMRIRL